MQRRSRYVARNSGFHREAVQLMSSLSVDGGIWPQSMAEDPEAAREIEQYFRQWANRPELSNRFDFLAVQHLVCRAIDTDGEIFAVKTFDKFDVPKLQLFESHQFSGITDRKRNIWDGIEYDSVGRPRYYHRSIPDSKETRRIPAASVLHVFEPESVTAARGIPTMQAGVNGLQDHLELLGFETHAVKQAAELGVVVKSNRAGALEDGDFGMDAEGSAPATSEAEIASALGGRAIRIDETEEVQSFASQRPNSMFDGFLRMLETEAAGGHLPHEILRDPSKVGGASVRMIAAKAERRTRYRQQILINRFLMPTFSYVIGRAIDRGELAPSKGWSKVHWQTPRKITVDAGREGQQARLDVESGLSTLSEYMGERGVDFDEWLAKRKDEAEKIQAAADEAGVPLWMIYKPTGVPFGGDNQQPQTL